MRIMKWLSIWLILFSFFVARNQVADGVLGPFKRLFCTEASCGFGAFDINRLLDAVFDPNKSLDLSIMMALLLSSALTFLFWRWSVRSAQSKDAET